MKHIALLLACLLPAAAADVAVKGKTAGSPKAPVTIEVFSDFQCAHCKLLHEQTLRPLMKDYVATGKVYLIHRDFPLPQHSLARPAAAYASAAQRIGKYDQVADAIFLNQEVWSANGRLEDIVAAALTSSEMKQVETLSKDPAIAKEIQRDYEMGQAAKINQTPTMIVKCNSITTPISGAVRYELLRSLIDGQLKNK